MASAAFQFSARFVATQAQTSPQASGEGAAGPEPKLTRHKAQRLLCFGSNEDGLVTTLNFEYTSTGHLYREIKEAAPPKENITTIPLEAARQVFQPAEKKKTNRAAHRQRANSGVNTMPVCSCKLRSLRKSQHRSLEGRHRIF